MLIDQLQRKLFAAKALAPVVNKYEDGKDVSLGLASSARPFMVASVYARHPRSMLVVVSGEEAATRFANDIAAFIGRANVLVLPNSIGVPWRAHKNNMKVQGARTKAICALAQALPIVVVTSARALMRKIAPASSNMPSDKNAANNNGALAANNSPAQTGSDVLLSSTQQANAHQGKLAPAPSGLFSPLIITKEDGLIDVATGEMLEYEQLAPFLIAHGYQHTESIDGAGTFAVHGDTVDIFAAGMNSPVRIEFFGDDVDGLRQVVASTGQSIRELDRVEICPAREFELNEQTITHLLSSLNVELATDSELASDVHKLEAGIAFDGMEKYLPYLYERLDTPIAHMSESTLVVLAEPRSLFDDACRNYDDLKALAQNAGLGADEVEKYYCLPAKLDFGSQQRFTLQSIMRVKSSVDADLKVEKPNVAGSEEKLFSLLHSFAAAKNTTAIFSIPDKHARKDIELSLVDNSISFTEQLPLRQDVLNITDIDIPSGFIIPDANIALISLSDLSVRAARHRSYKRIDITEVTFPFQPGDYVVHQHHGIAFFSEIVQQEVGGIQRDYLLLKYAQEDKLFVPIEQIDKITRYVGPEGSTPRLTRLNTADWDRAINKARKSAKKLAFDLVDLYARRSTVKGFSYSQDSMSQQEMEELFPYEETPDQLAAIEDVKADMESEKPMDRLICGDVGFGKTEVALRAAFKAVSDSRQVMVLCPTTILAQQHYATFSDRFEPFGIEVEVLSRFRTNAQQKQALKDFAAGKVDVLVGTHRLLSRDVNPKNLGLIIIDEEQRFGVGHKEQLKNLREQIDVLTLSATPIPRTLQMSLSGVRDMSLITTPPPNRRAVKVHVGEWDEDVVSAAIRREMQRGGQVYYVSNRVRTIDDAVERVTQAAPEARVGVAHGAMTAKQLEDVMEQFSAGEIDVLVATTIVESGLDNPHTNTLIIEDSQRLGLAQLYQLKGRVGRSLTQAYAFFLFPAGETLTDEARDRLEAINEFSDLGSGMKVAMRDLEIRGAGTLLGAEQSGNLSAVGFDLFASMIAEAVSDARGEETIAHSDIQVNVPLAFIIPEEYIPQNDIRVLFYRRLAAAQSVEDVEKIRKDLTENYGAMPPQTQNMCDRAQLKAMAQEHGIKSIAQVAGKIVLESDAKRPVRFTIKKDESPLKQTIEYLEKLNAAIVQ